MTIYVKVDLPLGIVGCLERGTCMMVESLLDITCIECGIILDSILDFRFLWETSLDWGDCDIIVWSHIVSCELPERALYI